MPEPVSTKMFAPAVPQQDLSPILESMRINGEQSLATQQGIVAGFAQERDIQAKKQTVEEERKDRQKKLDHLEQTMTDLSDPQQFKTETVEPWRNDPELAGAPDAVAAKQIKVARLTAAGVPYTDALAQAETLVRTQYIRYVKPEKAADMRAKLARAKLYWNEVGGSDGGLEKFVNMTAGEDAFLTAEEAHAAASRRYTDELRGLDASKRELQKTEINAERDRQAASFQQQRDLAVQEAGIRSEEATTAFGRAKIMDAFHARMQNALRKGNTEDAIAIQQASNQFELERQTALQKQGGELQLQLQDNEIKAAAAIAAAKAHEFTPSEQDTAQNLGQTIGQVTSNAPVPLSSFAGAARGGALGDFVEQFSKAAARYQSGFASPQGAKQIDIGRFDVAIGPKGQVLLSDRGDGAGKKLDQPTLDKIAKSVFRNDQARFAVAMSQAYGGLFETGSDLEITYRVAQRTGMDQLLFTRLSLLAGAGAAPPPPGSNAPPPPGGVDPYQGLIQHK